MENRETITLESEPANHPRVSRPRRRRTAGATEALASSILALCEAGDEVVMFEPYYDAYASDCALAGAVRRVVTLRAPDFSFDPDELRAAVGPATRMLILNTPHNPTGKVFDADELALISRHPTGAEPIGKIVIGTVKGDIHDIGKNLVSMMMEGAGLEVIDIGINNPVENYLEALEEHQPDILGMSALLTTTMPKMEETIEALKEAGVRDQVKIMAGGAPVTQDFIEKIGADAYGANAAAASEKAKALLA